MPAGGAATRAAWGPPAHTPIAASFNLLLPHLCSSPGVSGTALSPTTANIVIRPPSGGPWDNYQLTLCPVGGPATRCIVVTCRTTACPVTGLTPGTSYVVKASGACVCSGFAALCSVCCAVGWLAG